MATIKGRVVDYDNDIPLPDVDILGLAKDGIVFVTAKTDSEGLYNITDTGFDDPFAKIEFSKEGYAVQTMRPTSANNVDVPLPKAKTLGAVVVAVRNNKTKAFLFAALGALAVWLYIKYGKNLLK
jgi:hypothetical protein